MAAPEPRRPRTAAPSARSGRAGILRRRRALVTGGAGFIGSHLVDRLIAEGEDVLVIDDLSSGRLESLNPAARFERRDIAEAALDSVAAAWRPATVYHLAAQASVARSAADPLRDLAVNVAGTVRICAAAAAAGATRLVFVSSGGAIYGESRRAADERTLPTPRSAYGVHKLAAEGHVRLGAVPYAVLRPGNVYGPRQRGGLEGAVVAAFLDQVPSGSLQIHGDGRQARDFIHVRDVVEALVRLATIEPSGTWNVGSGRSTTIEQLAGLIEALVQRPLVRGYHARRPGDVDHSAISIRRLRATGWEPRIALRDGLRELIDERGLREPAGSKEPGTQGPSPSDR